MLSDQLACAPHILVEDRVDSAKEASSSMPTPCEAGLNRLVHRDSSRSLWISSPPGHALADFAECPRSRASTRCAIVNRAILGPQNPRRNQQESRQQFLHHKENTQQEPCKRFEVHTQHTPTRAFKYIGGANTQPRSLPALLADAFPLQAGSNEFRGDALGRIG